MFEGWDNYFVLTGTAAGGLIGLLFVVITLTAGFERSRALKGSEIYMTPNLVHFAIVLVASAVVLAPRVPPRVMALILAGAALSGLGNAVRTCLGIRDFAQNGSPPHWSDMPLYGVAPGVLYVLLLGVAAAIWLQASFAAAALAAFLMVLMLLSIRNAWDLITWMAPGPPPSADAPPPAAK
jgi:hypothetical protein